MALLDFQFIFYWWFVLFLIGTIFLPITSLIFNNFFDQGYIFSKILGILILSYIIFLLGSLKILPFTQFAVFLLLLTFLVLNVFLISKYPSILVSLKSAWKLFLFEELIFLGALFFWSYIRAHEPSIHGLEKYMDFGFVNSILRSEYFPPKDMWYTPLPINYYYFGHLVTAVLTKLSGINSAVTYNLMIATLFAFTFTGAFSIGANLILRNYKLQITNYKQAPNSKILNFKHFGYWNLFGVWNLRFGVLVAGLLTAFLVTLAGNLHTIYSFFAPYVGENPVPFWKLGFDWNLDNYWYPNATRFIPFTIHEFPIYSFVVSDLHGHVLSIPIVLTIIALLLNSLGSQSLNFLKIIFLSFLIAVAYMTNAWDGLIYALLIAVVFFYLSYRSKSYQLYATFARKQALLIRYTLILVGAILFSLPFSLHFKPFVSGIGVLCAPEFLTRIRQLSPFIFEADHCQRSPLWQLLILHGFWYFWVISFIVFIFKLNAKRYFRQKASFAYTLYASDVFILILIGLSTLLIFVPEFIYAKDIYPTHYRANTMFKLGYQAFIMLGIATGYILIRLVTGHMLHVTRKVLRFPYVLLASCLVLLVMIYPYFTINSFYGGLKNYRGLNGLSYLKELYPDDYEAISWINKAIGGQPVILEAVGESYTTYARISTNTGLPTVLGWPVHEWLWRGTYDIASPRIADVQRIYETDELILTKNLVREYNIKYVFVGELEYQKYANLNEKKFEELGQIIFENSKTRIYQLNL